MQVYDVSLNARANLKRMHFDAPYLLFCLFIFSIPFEAPLQFMGKEVTAFPLLGLVAFAMWFGDVVIRKSKIRGFRGQGLLAATAAGYILSSAAHGFQYADIRTIITVFELAIMMILIINICTSMEKIVFLGKVILFSCTVNSLLAIYLGLEGNYIDTAQNFERIYGLSSAVPRLALYSSTGAIFTFFQMRNMKKKKEWIFSLFCIAVNLLSLLLTISLTVSFALLFSSLIWLLISHNERITLLIKRTLLILLFSFAVALLFSEPIFQSTNIYLRTNNRLEQIQSATYYDWGSQRVGAWFASVEVIMENPFFGVGRAEMPYAIARRFPGLYNFRRLASHNLILGLATEFGLLTVIPFVLLITVILFRLYRTISRLPKEWNSRFRYIGDSLFVSLVFIIGCGMGLDYQRHKYLWMIMALSIAYTSLVKKQSCLIRKT